MNRVCQIGSTPFDRNVAAAEGAVRKRINALGCIRFFRGRRQTCRETDFRLQFLGNGADHIDAGDIHDARGDDNHQIGVAASDHLDRVFRFHRFELALHLRPDPHAIEQADEIQSAGALARIGDGSCRKQSAPEGLHR